MESETDTISMEGLPLDASRGTPASWPLDATATTREMWIKVEEIVNLEQSVDRPITIFKVPKHIREVNPKAYDPVVASVGPFHHCPYCWSSVMQDPKIQTKSPLDREAYKPVAASCGHFDRAYPYSTSAMQNYKWRCVWHLLSHRENDPERANQLLDECLVKLKEKNDEVRRCYSEELPPWMDDRKLASIMLLDGCFIIYLMLRRKKSLKKDAVGKKRIQCTFEREEGNVVLDIEEEDEQFDWPTGEGLFTVSLVLKDLLKLENQIPFFIIQLLFDQLKPCGDDLIDLALNRFQYNYPKESQSFRDNEKKYTSPGKYHHLLHLFYSSRIHSPEKLPEPPTPGCIHLAIKCIESKWKKAKAAIDRKISKIECRMPGCILGATEYMKSTWKKVKAAFSQASTQRTWTSAPKWCPCAIELDRAGVKFQKNKLANSFLNITFKWRKFMPLLGQLCFTSGRMEIPPLQIYDRTDHLFRNLIAFEQCYPFPYMHITTYAIFMDCIIDQAEDVRLLQSKGILEHGLGNDQAVADLFNQLGCQIHITKKNYLIREINEIHKFCDVKWHKWHAALRRDYCGNPWTTISVSAAIFLLLLTVEQAVFSVFSYFRSP